MERVSLHVDGFISHSDPFAFCPSVVVKNPADFIGSFIGHSESQTKAILATTVGKVLIIDEVRHHQYDGRKEIVDIDRPTCFTEDLKVEAQTPSRRL